jgi:cathepsin B
MFARSAALVVTCLTGAWAALLRQDLIVEHINSIEASWEAGINSRFQGLSLEEVRWQMGVLESGSKLQVKTDVANHIPEQFDARTAWPNCSSISQIREQGNCGSCWVCT